MRVDQPRTCIDDTSGIVRNHNMDRTLGITSFLRTARKQKRDEQLKEEYMPCSCPQRQCVPFPCRNEYSVYTRINEANARTAHRCPMARCRVVLFETSQE